MDKIQDHFRLLRLYLNIYQRSRRLSSTTLIVPDRMFP